VKPLGGMKHVRHMCPAQRASHHAMPWGERLAVAGAESQKVWRRGAAQAEACARARARQAYADYHDMMALTEDLVRTCATDIAGGLRLTYQGQALDFGPPFRRATMHALVQEATGAPARRSMAQTGPLGVFARLAWRSARGRSVPAGSLLVWAAHVSPAVAALLSGLPFLSALCRRLSKAVRPRLPCNLAIRRRCNADDDWQSITLTQPRWPARRGLQHIRRRRRSRGRGCGRGAARGGRAGARGGGGWRGEHRGHRAERLLRGGARTGSRQTRVAFPWVGVPCWASGVLAGVRARAGGVCGGRCARAPHLESPPWEAGRERQRKRCFKASSAYLSSWASCVCT